MKKWKLKKNINRRLLFFFGMILISNILFSFNFFSPISNSERINVTNEKREFVLSHNPVIINSEFVIKDSIQLKRNQDYTIDYLTGKITFTQNLGNVFVEYQKYPADLKEKFYLFEEQEYSVDKKVKLPPKRNPLFSNTTKLQISGSKTIAVSVSRNEDFSLDQSLFLKMDGELSENLNIEAQLSDSQTPITPEGNSREISNLDKVFLRLYSTNYELAFGDLEVDYHNTKFMNYAPKFEGLKATWQRRNTYQAALAISKGKSTSIQFAGVEAKQGPYYLTNNSSQLIQVVAGTEQVFLNGKQMQRGDDYIIDYAEGSITFDNKHFISSNSLIQVNFQYSDEYFRQNMYLAHSEVNISEKFKIRNYLVFQNDDKDNPLQTEFTEADIDSLTSGGDKEIWGSGVYETEDGDYILTDNGFYEYVGNDSTIVGNYTIHFEFVGFEQGDYDLVDNENYYIFAGTGEGDYLPITKLTAPQKKANYDLILDYETETFQTSAEAIYTQHDRNTYSKKDDGDNEGFAANFSTRYFPDLDLIKPDFSVNYRLIGKNLNTFAELSNPLANYESVQIPDSVANNTFNGNLKFNIKDFISPEFRFSQKKAKDFADQNYYYLSSISKQLKYIPAINYKFAKLAREYETSQTFRFDQHDLDSRYKINWLQFNFIYHNKETDQKLNIYSSQISNKNWQIGMQTINTKKFGVEFFLKKELQKTVIDTTDVPFKDETSYTFGINSKLNLKNHNADLQFSHREIYDDVENDKKNFDLAEINTGNSFFKRSISLTSGYAFQNVEFYPKIRELQLIGEGMGSYDEDSLYVGFGQGDYDWKIVEIDYDNPQMSVEVNTNFTLNLTPSMITESFLKKIKTESNLQISENSKAADKTKIYLLNPDILMNKESSLYSRILQQQTVWLDIIKNKLRAKLRYKQEDILDNRYNEISEETNKLNWEGNLRFSAISKTVIELILERNETEESRYQSFSEIDSYALEIRNQITDDANLKSALEYGREAGRKTDNSSDYEIASYKLTEILTYYLSSKYRFFGKVSWKRNERTGSEFLSFLDDKKDGNIIKWNLNFDYRVSSITSAHFEYSGEVIPDKPTEHKISLEVKAEF
ncbi:MAG: hypothetical protein K9N39_01950 [Candidatus Cloacimonetes bacterium]|nr:hypothetical protein [Candidatus Cloacimonadota bacterium]MCF7813401.1 hypothetical protein [Candidatus Cloacimonadota bacterium]